MNIFDIPFHRHISIAPSESSKSDIFLPSSHAMTNHLGTIHASAQFALAEACSGHCMLRTFPEYIKGHVAVLRNSKVTYKKQTRDNIYGLASIDEESIRAFKTRLEKKGRSIIPVQVTVRDENADITMKGTFEWYVQKIKEGEAPLA